MAISMNADSSLEVREIPLPLELVVAQVVEKHLCAHVVHEHLHVQTVGRILASGIK